MATVTIVGAGMMGSALAFPAAENGHIVRVVGTHLDREIIDFCRKNGRHPKFDAYFTGGKTFPPNVKFYQIEELSIALQGTDLLIGGISSFGVDWFSDTVLNIIPENLPVLTVTKGLINLPDGRLICFPDYWEQKNKGKKLSISAIAGPCTSYELVAHDNTVVTYCGKDLTVLERIRRIMQTNYYHIALSTDVVGVESAVALKNGYALGVAMTIGLNEINKNLCDKEHYNSQAAAFGQAAKEMRKLIFHLGGGADSIDLGIGDLYVTVFGGRTRLLGRLLGRGLTVSEAMAELAGVTLESRVIAERVARAIQVQGKDGKLNAKEFPLLTHVDAVLKGEAVAELPWGKFTV